MGKNDDKFVEEFCVRNGLKTSMLLGDHATEHQNRIWDKSHSVCTQESEDAFNQKHRNQIFKTKGKFEVTMQVRDGIERRVEEKMRKVTTRKPDRFWWLHR